MAWELRDTFEGEAGGDQLGHSVSVSGDGKTLAVGAPYHDGNNGHVRVFKWNAPDIWEETVPIPESAEEDEMFGWSVSLSDNGEKLAIGGINGGNNNTGVVRVFNWVGTAWNQLGDDIIGDIQYEQNGYSVSLSSDGTVLAIGSESYEGGTGRVRVFNGTVLLGSIRHRPYGKVK